MRHEHCLTNSWESLWAADQFFTCEMRWKISIIWEFTVPATRQRATCNVQH